MKLPNTSTPPEQPLFLGRWGHGDTWNSLSSPGGLTPNRAMRGGGSQGYEPSALWLMTHGRNNPCFLLFLLRMSGECQSAVSICK